MANELSTYTPKFGVEYIGNHVIISSDRITLHSKTDSIFLFGKQSVCLSSIGTVNLDASSGIILEAPSVRLGSHSAKEQVILGNKHNLFLSQFLDTVATASDVFIKTVSAGEKPANPELGSAMLKIAIFAQILSNACLELKNKLSNSLSTTTYTV
jgi:hypothetical protein